MYNPEDVELQMRELEVQRMRVFVGWVATITDLHWNLNLELFIPNKNIYIKIGVP